MNGQRGSRFNRFDVLLDNQASASIFKEPMLLKNIRRADSITTVSGIGGSIEVYHVGDHDLFGTISFSTEALANVLSFSAIKEMYTVEYDNQLDIFVVHINASTSLSFENKSGLYVCRLKPYMNESVVVSTALDNEKLYSKRQVEDAKAARKLMKDLG